jgi:hypothetical protein
MTLPRLEGLNKAWKSSPPVHVAVARYLGWGKGSSPEEEADIEQYMAGLPAAEIKR